MSQVRNDGNGMNLSHYAANELNESRISHTAPEELSNAKPLPQSSSGWKLAGRVFLGIVSLGTSELLRLAWKGMKSFVVNASPAQLREPRAQGKNGLPAAAHDADVEYSLERIV